MRTPQGSLPWLDSFSASVFCLRSTSTCLLAREEGGGREGDVFVPWRVLLLTVIAAQEVPERQEVERGKEDQGEVKCRIDRSEISETEHVS